MYRRAKIVAKNKPMLLTGEKKVQSVKAKLGVTMMYVKNLGSVIFLKSSNLFPQKNLVRVNPCENGAD
jgi:hypothetical protein